MTPSMGGAAASAVGGPGMMNPQIGMMRPPAGPSGNVPMSGGGKWTSLAPIFGNNKSICTFRYRLSQRIFDGRRFYGNAAGRIRGWWSARSADTAGATAADPGSVWYTWLDS